MTLRLRLVLGLVALVVVGLAVFGVTTYVLYARSEYRRLDERLSGVIPIVTNQLYENAGLNPEDGHEPGGIGSGERPGGPGGRPPILVPSGTYAELRESIPRLVAGLHAVASLFAEESTIPTHHERS